MDHMVEDGARLVIEQQAVILQRNSQRAIEGQRCFGAIVSIKALCFSSDLKGGWISRLLGMLVDTALARASGLADDCVRQ